MSILQKVSADDLRKFAEIADQQKEMKATLLSDIERGFEALKSRLDFAPRVNVLDTELN